MSMFPWLMGLILLKRDVVGDSKAEGGWEHPSATLWDPCCPTWGQGPQPLPHLHPEDVLGEVSNTPTTPNHNTSPKQFLSFPSSVLVSNYARFVTHFVNLSRFTLREKCTCCGVVATSDIHIDHVEHEYLVGDFVLFPGISLTKNSGKGIN